MLTGGRGAAWAGLLASVAWIGCRREAPVPPAAPLEPPVVSAPADVAPSFENTPEGAARQFMYALACGDEAMLRAAIQPDARWRILLTMNIRDARTRRETLQRVMSEPVREFKPGDQFPVGPAGGEKEMRIVPAGGLDENRRLVMLLERGLLVIRDEDRWRVFAEPVIDELEAELRANRPPDDADSPVRSDRSGESAPTDSPTETPPRQPL